MAHTVLQSKRTLSWSDTRRHILPTTTGKVCEIHKVYLNGS